MVQGFGNVGSVAAAHLQAMGLTITAASDLTGAIHNDNGVNIDALAAHVLETGGVAGFDGAKTIDTKAILELPCDVLVPAAAAGQITADNADRIQARILAEGANGPTTVDADEVLVERGIFIIPDILCNAGGVFVSYLEYTQETQAEQMEEDQVNARLDRRMKQKFTQVYELAQQRGWPMRDAAMCLAVKTVAEALEARGTLP